MNTHAESSKADCFSGWKAYVLFALMSFLFAFALRCVDLPKWDNPAFMIDGEYILGTHDAYAWLAGAKGVGRAVSNPMAGLVKTIGELTGAPYGNIAFWLPAVFAGFTAIAAFSWGMLVAGPWIGLCAGVFATSIPLFYFRTRLSYYDTDLVTLLFPLLISVLLAYWVSRGIRNSWLPSTTKTDSFQPSISEYIIPIVAGGCVSYGRLWHGDVFLFGLFALFASIFLVLLCGYKESKATLLKGITAFSLAAMLGWVGILLSVFLIIFSEKKEFKCHRFLGSIYLYLLVIFLVLIFSDAGVKFIFLWSKIQSYLKPVSDVVVKSAAQIHYPSIGQSVIEVQNVKLVALLGDLTGSMYLSCFGLLGFLFLLAKRPYVLLLLPFALMTAAAVKLGGRFAMFGGVVLGLGGSYFLYWLMVSFLTLGKKQRVCAAIAPIFLIALLMLNVFPQYKRAMPTPIIYQEHARALKAMSTISPAESTFWTWWDWGYVTMYYTGKKSFADGSNHGGTTLFPLAFAYTTPSFMQANQFIKYSASHNGVPATAWNKMDVKDVVNLVRSFGFKNYEFKDTPKQYIIASWADVRLAYWILYYGSCNLLNGQGVHPNISAVRSGFNLDREVGRVTFDDGNALPLSGYAVASLGVGESNIYPQSAGPFLVYNSYLNYGYLVDDLAKNSLLFRLLLMDPAAPEINGRFKLVYEGFPMIRIYEVL
ncbi:STT3 domain-containing protein [Maridesulfovibrio salexigens]|uniref:Oligosaccharyl transferase STT3 subunit n=1 Tax=Maridesulfovibrio salexigens (strain ATCC 14822 / DSM 2638 / NCIMB 8403 / VKM B-1763) TaxID=526222 RepID=C6BTY3_MARSD|nr:STT3 domain-containing protein [Maridesulfovibrio salexigens]ACS81692.1 conserved hypothetical protein [Maridesulfovibrio salexigens DSM 2638]